MFHSSHMINYIDFNPQNIYFGSNNVGKVSLHYKTSENRPTPIPPIMSLREAHSRESKCPLDTHKCETRKRLSNLMERLDLHYDGDIQYTKVYPDEIERISKMPNLQYVHLWILFDKDDFYSRCGCISQDTTVLDTLAKISLWPRERYFVLVETYIDSSRAAKKIKQQFRNVVQNEGYYCNMGQRLSYSRDDRLYRPF